MAEDKALWHEALAHYRAWNEAEFIDRVQRAGERTPAEKWRIFLDLMAFGRRIRPSPSEHAQQREAIALQTYYAHIRQFESRRQHHEQSP